MEFSAWTSIFSFEKDRYVLYPIVAHKYTKNPIINAIKALPRYFIAKSLLLQFINSYERKLPCYQQHNCWLIYLLLEWYINDKNNISKKEYIVNKKSKNLWKKFWQLWIKCGQQYNLHKFLKCGIMHKKYRRYYKGI